MMENLKHVDDFLGAIYSIVRAYEETVEDCIEEQELHNILYDLRQAIQQYDLAHALYRRKLENIAWAEWEKRKTELYDGS